MSLTRNGKEDMNQEEILSSASHDRVLDPLTQYLFPSGVSSGDELVDLKLIAYELHEMAEAIRGRTRIEVDGICGLKDVAALYAIFESWHTGRALQLTEVENGQVAIRSLSMMP